MHTAKNGWLEVKNTLHPKFINAEDSTEVLGNIANKYRLLCQRAIAEYEPAIVATFQDEHIEDERLVRQLNKCVDNVIRSSSLLENQLQAANSILHLQLLLHLI